MRQWLRCAPLNEAAPTLADLDVLDRRWVVYKEEKGAREVEA